MNHKERLRKMIHELKADSYFEDKPFELLKKLYVSHGLMLCTDGTVKKDGKKIGWIDQHSVDYIDEHGIKYKLKIEGTHRFITIQHG